MNMQTATTTYSNRSSLVLATSTFYITLFLLSLIAIEMALPRIDERRVNFPVFFVLACPLILMATRNIINTSFYRARLFTLAMAAYLGWCIVTCYWAPTPSESVFHALLMTFGLLLASGGLKFSAHHTIRIFTYLSFAVFIFSWVALLISPDYALQSKGIWRLSGVMEHEFRLGYLAAINCVICLIWLCMKDPEVKPPVQFILALGLLALVTLFATQTRTLLLYTSLSLGLVGFFHLAGKPKLFFLLMGIMSLVMVSAFSDQILDSMSRGESDGSLSGRTIVWEKSLEASKDSMLLGHGFASYIDPEYDSIWPGYRAPHAHNTWIMALFETGIIGTVLLSAAMLLMLLQSYRIGRQLHRPSFAFYVTLFCVFSGMTGLIYGGKLTTLMGFSVLLFYQENRERNALLAQGNGPRSVVNP